MNKLILLFLLCDTRLVSKNKQLRHLVVRHSIPAGNLQVIVIFTIISERTVQNEELLTVRAGSIYSHWALRVNKCRPKLTLKDNSL